VDGADSGIDMQTGNTGADINSEPPRTGQEGSFWNRCYQALIQPTGQAAPAPPPLTPTTVLMIGLLLAIWRGAILAISVIWSRVGIDDPWEGDGTVHGLLRHSIHWDSGWYFSVVREGYSYNPEAQSNIAFFPMLPYLTRLFDQILPGGDAFAGLVVVHLALFGALLYIFQLVRIDYTDVVAWRTLFFLLIFPAAFFFSAFYAESLLIFGMAATLYHARRGQWLMAGLFGTFTGLSKLIGVILIIPVGLELLRQRALNRHNLQAWLGGALTLVGGIAYLVFLQVRLGDFRVYFWNQEHWNRDSFDPEPFVQFAQFLTGQDYGYLPYPGGLAQLHTHYFLMDMGSLIVFLIAGVYLWLRVQPAYGALVLAGAMVPALSGTPLALARYMVILFPVFLLAGRIKSEPVRYGLVIVSIFGLVATTYLFVNGHWAG
jgi:hypothetical protein